MVTITGTHFTAQQNIPVGILNRYIAESVTYLNVQCNVTRSHAAKDEVQIAIYFD